MKKIFTTIILCALAIATASAQDYLSFVSNQDGSTLKLSSQGSGSVNVDTLSTRPTGAPSLTIK